MISKMIALSKSYQHFGLITESRKYLDSAKIYIQGKMVKHIQMELLLTESDYYSLVKQPDSALHYYRLYNQYRDVLNLNLQKNQSILLLAQFEIGKRRSELAESNQSLIDIRKKSNAQNTQIILLIVSLLTSIMMVFFIYKNSLQKTKDKRYIEKQNELLQKSNDIINAQFHHNEILLKELHHRVKNNLQVMYSLLNLQKRRNQDKDTIVLLSSVQNRIQTMALLHQNLYTTGDMEMVDISSYVITLTKYLRSIYKLDSQKVHLQYEIDPELKLDIETVVSIGLIINEAVSNAFKYAFTNRKEGTLIIRIHQKENEYTLFIKDDGPGFNEWELKENSLGMKLIKVMCAQLQATYSIEINNGVSHTIHFTK
jgi:two-component sensor histidine kinase